MQRETALLANVVTIWAHDVQTLRDFYLRLAWPQVVDQDHFAAFALRGVILALCPLDKLAADGRSAPERRHGGVRRTIGVIVDRPDEVDALARLVRESGGRVTKEPVDAEFFEGRSAYVADPEGNYWEIAWAPPENPIVAAARRAARGA